MNSLAPQRASAPHLSLVLIKLSIHDTVHVQVIWVVKLEESPLLEARVFVFSNFILSPYFITFHHLLGAGPPSYDIPGLP